MRRVLSMWQSWATLCVAPLLSTGRPAKRHETRAFAPRGPFPIDVVIHATKKWDRNNAYTATDPLFIGALRESGFLAGPTTRLGVFADPNLKPLPFGKIIGIATIIGVHRTEDLFDDRLKRREITTYDLAFGDWRPGRFAWEFANTALLLDPIPFKGRQDVLSPLIDAGIMARIEEQLGATI